LKNDTKFERRHVRSQQTGCFTFDALSFFQELPLRGIKMAKNWKHEYASWTRSVRSLREMWSFLLLFANMYVGLTPAADAEHSVAKKWNCQTGDYISD